MKTLDFAFLEQEAWYGLGSVYGTKLPLTAASTFDVDFVTTFTGNQEAPFLVSSCGRYVWSESPFRLTVKDGMLRFEGQDDLELHEGFETLRGAYLDACARFFRPNGKLPAENFFKKRFIRILIYNSIQQVHFWTVS